MTGASLLLIALASLLVTWISLFAIRRFAPRLGLLDVPNARSSHFCVTPRGGGLPIVVVTLAGLLVCGWLSGLARPWVLPFVLTGSLIAAVSCLDDLRSVRPWFRLAVHAAAASAAMLCLGYFDRVAVPLLGELRLGIAGPVLTLVWIVGLTNAYNFMDGIDGIAGTQAVLAGLGWCLLAGDPQAMLLGVLVASASLGFLAHNWSPARVFMGDVGSAFLGYTFAILPLVAHGGDFKLPFAGLLLVWPFVFDSSLTFLRRLIRGENVLAAHRSHFYQRLVVTGLSHTQVASLYTALAGTGLLAAIIWSSVPGADNLIILAVLPLLALALVLSVVARESEPAVQRRRAAAASDDLELTLPLPRISRPAAHADADRRRAA